MFKQLNAVTGAIVAALGSRRRLAAGAVSAVAVAFLSVYLPVVTTPGNTLAFQLSLLTWGNATLIAVFSVLFGVSIALNSYENGLRKTGAGLAAGRDAITGMAGVAGGVLSSPLCPLCISAILGTVGVGASATLFVLSNRAWIMAAAILVIVASIYATGKSASRFCERCGQ